MNFNSSTLTTCGKFKKYLHPSCRTGLRFFLVDTYLWRRCTVRSWAAPCRRGRWLGRRWSAPAAAPSASPGAGSTASGRCWRWGSAPRGTRGPRRLPSGATTCCGNHRSRHRLRVHGKQKQHKNTCFSTKRKQNIRQAKIKYGLFDFCDEAVKKFGSEVFQIEILNPNGVLKTNFGQVAIYIY